MDTVVFGTSRTRTACFRTDTKATNLKLYLCPDLKPYKCLEHPALALPISEPWKHGGNFLLPESLLGLSLLSSQGFLPFWLVLELSLAFAWKAPSGWKSGDDLLHYSALTEVFTKQPYAVDSGHNPIDEDQLNISLEPVENEPESTDIDDPLVRGTRSIANIYHRCNVAIVEPSSYEEAARDKCWKKARPEESHRCQVGFRAKFNSDGSLNKHKARLVVKGYSQEYGTDFIETFAPVARLDTIKLLFALAAPRAWYDRVDAYLCRLGFVKSLSEPTLYVKKTEDETLLIVSVYVDDLLVTGSRIDLINDFKTQMQEVFDMTDLGVMTYFLGMEVNQSDRGIFISQHTFALKILDKFCMTNCKSVSTPVARWEKLSSNGNETRVDEKEYRSLVGCLLYLTATRPDIMFGVSLLSRFMDCCNMIHLKTAKKILRYIRGTLNHGVMFKKENELKLTGYSDSDWTGSVDNMKSTSGYFFTLGSNVFCWSSKKQ
ncbi:hypothetical protein CXB51_026034 [Gossypium anomalum]|uniref:Reverse transcriptase Ty1/copia-type domain-containing protein n=1 Tax=Gossypium anomalum TaxID=47600 RepID=A0A8J6CQV8_9ROSI|nr:hypothetical protein CXB51_026034 [Gossypium anomalum]